MFLSVDSRLRVYQIVAPLGEGAMGAVYRARDTRLNRDVAIKVLQPSLAGNPERLARFRREAQTLASLNHPHVGAIYGLEEADGAIALVLELVEGRTLADRIARGPLPSAEALPIARQIAEAIEAAHDRGIVHRDLKPANIKIRDDGTVKVLDFGLARVLDAAETSSRHGIDAPTTIAAPAAMTGIGVVLGTPAYMSPEQAAGRTADRRSDIWAFGCVLYEMLTGRRAFAGDDMPSVVAAVMTGTPGFGAVPADTPPALRRLVRQCLQKDPRRRLQAIADARVQIEDLLAGISDDVTSGADAPARSRWQRLGPPVAVAIIVGVVSAGITWIAGRRSATPPRVSRLNIAPDDAATFTVGVSRDIAITPDGSRLVYVGANATTLFVRPLDQIEPTAIVRGSGLRDPFVSPDGQWVGFFDGGLTLRKVPISGGPAILIARLDSFERGAVWLADGSIVFATQSSTNGLQRIGGDGGTPEVLTRPDHDRGEAGHAWPELLPDGRAILYTVLPRSGGLDAASLAVFDGRSRQSTILLGGGSHAQYVTSGHLVYGTRGTLRAVPFDVAARRITGGPVTVVPQVATTGFGGVNAVVARDGTLVYITGVGIAAAARVMVWVDRQGREMPLASPPRAYYFPRLSTDGTRVAVNAVVDQDSDIWVWDLRRATLARVTSDPAQDAFPLWTRDGRAVVFGSNRSRAFNLFSQAADGTGAVQRLTDTVNPQYPSGISPDGGQLVFTELSPVTGYDVMAMPIDGSGRAVPLVQTSFDERNGVVSSDNRWLAYEANDTGAFEIYVRPYPDMNGGRWQVSTAGGTQPLWAPGGHELFYFAPDGTLMHVPVGSGSVWSGGAPTRLLDARYVVSTGGNVPRNYDIAPDGQRLLMLKANTGGAAPAPARMVVVQHFDEEMKRVVTTK